MQILRFKYNGGSHPGAIRTVIVESADKANKTITGVDLGYNTEGSGEPIDQFYDVDYSHTRQFAIEKMSDVEQAEIHAVPIVDFPNTTGAYKWVYGWLDDELSGFNYVLHGSYHIVYRFNYHYSEGKLNHANSN